MSQYTIRKLESEIAGIKTDIDASPEYAPVLEKELRTLHCVLEAEQRYEERHQKWMNDREGA